MTSLARFPIVQRAFRGPAIYLRPFAAYNIEEYLPEAEFEARMKALKLLIRQHHPSALVEIVFLFVSAGAVFAVAVLSVFSFQMHFNFPYQILIVIVPFIFGVWHLFRKRAESARMDTFEAKLRALLKEFTDMDLATRNIKWSLKKCHGAPYIVSGRSRGMMFWRVELRQADAEAEVDELPQYRTWYDEPAVLAAEPPNYEEPIREIAIEIDGVEDGADSGLGRIVRQLRDSGIGEEILLEPSESESESRTRELEQPIPMDGPPSYRDSVAGDAVIAWQQQLEERERGEGDGIVV